MLLPPYIVLACRTRPAEADNAPAVTSLTALKGTAARPCGFCSRGNIAPVDLAQAAIGPRHGRVFPLPGVEAAAKPHDRAHGLGLD